MTLKNLYAAALIVAGLATLSGCGDYSTHESSGQSAPAPSQTTGLGAAAGVNGPEIDWQVREVALPNGYTVTCIYASRPGYRDGGPDCDWERPKRP